MQLAAGFSINNRIILFSGHFLSVQPGHSNALRFFPGEKEKFFPSPHEKFSPDWKEQPPPNILMIAF